MRQTLSRLTKKVTLFLRRHPIISFFLLIIAGGVGFLVFLLWDLPLPDQLGKDEANPVSTLILDRNGKLIYEIFGEKRRTPVTLEELPTHLIQATVAIEDKDFYKHHGFSLRGVGRAVFNIVAKDRLQGGSTITQQLVKTTLLTPERTLARKVRELAIALIVETIYSKDKILEMYLNNVPYGGTAWGIEAAANTYFNKSASELTLAESALLAGLPAAPTRFSPFGAHPELAKERQAAVLRRMAEDGYISGYAADKALDAELIFLRPKGIKAPHFALWVKEQLVAEFGQHVVERGGLRVTTTLDLSLQEFAQEVVSSEVANLEHANVGNGAALVTAPATGEIYAMVGSKDYFTPDEDGKVNVTLRPRQPGSAIKPLNYALAFEKGRITPATVLADVPTCFNVPGQDTYCPTNYDGKFHGGVQARFALGNSYNIPAVRVLTLNNVGELVEFAKRMGLTNLGDSSDYGLSFTLGGGEVRMVDMAVAFGVFANGGIRQDLVSVLEVKDWKGNVLKKIEPATERILSEGTAFLISHILLDNNARTAAFGGSSLLRVRGHPNVSVKTGTTNDRRDNWTIGYNPEVVVATWVGNNNNTPMSYVASGVTGATPIWNKIISEALDRIEQGELGSWSKGAQEHEHASLEKPEETVVGANVCVDTGQLVSAPNSEEGAGKDAPTTAGCPTRFEYFLKDYMSETVKVSTRPIHVFRDTGMLANTEEAMPEQIEVKDKRILEDPLGTLLCLDCPVQLWETTVNTQKFFRGDDPIR